MSEYWQKLKSPMWQKKRLDIMQRDEFSCVSCGCSDNTLNVHHKTYRKGADPWEYEDANFATLCEDCHTFIHDSIEKIKYNITTSMQCEILLPVSKYKNLYDLTHINTLRLILDDNLIYRNEVISQARIKMAEDLIAEMQRVVAIAKNKDWRNPFDELDKMIGDVENDSVSDVIEIFKNPLVQDQ